MPGFESPSKRWNFRINTMSIVIGEPYLKSLEVRLLYSFHMYRSRILCNDIKYRCFKQSQFCSIHRANILAVKWSLDGLHNVEHYVEWNKRLVKGEKYFRGSCWENAKHPSSQLASLVTYGSDMLWLRQIIRNDDDKISEVTLWSKDIAWRYLILEIH